jgi:GNAT superfamily N-acetyltransferase
MYIRFIPEGALITPELKRQIEDVDHQAFSIYPPEDTNGIQWASEDEYWELGFLDGVLVSQLCLLRREIKVADQKLWVAGVGAVATLPTYQRRGLGSELMLACNQFMRDTMQVPFGLLVCGPDKQSFYEKAGWKFAASEMIITQNGEDRIFPTIVMVICLTDQPWPAGAIHLCGKPW